MLTCIICNINFGCEIRVFCRETVYWFSQQNKSFYNDAFLGAWLCKVPEPYPDIHSGMWEQSHMYGQCSREYEACKACITLQW